MWGSVAEGWTVALWLAACCRLAAAYQLDVSSKDSIKSTAKSMAADMMSFYHGNEPGQTPGLLPDPYYWWEAGALMGALVDYWYYTGDTTYNAITQQGLLFQVGPDNDYMPPNQTLTEGNDDQGFWGMAVMSAAEYNFQDPPEGSPGWLALAQAVFNTQAYRWDATECGGGLRWQIFDWNKGFDYKNSISQACFFNIAARLALYTGNQSYAAWAEKTWDWMETVQLINPDSYYVYDGAHIENCSSITPYQWTYNAGAFLLGAAAMYNYTNGSDTWQTRTEGLLNGTEVFFTGTNRDIMTEVACETVNLCDVDQKSFKAYLSRWMAATTKWAPWSYDKIKPLLESSAVAAAAQCTGGDNGRMCGLKWGDNGTWDGTTGVGQQMAAMEVVLGTMISEVKAPLTNSTGGTSTGNAGAGGSDVGKSNPDPAADLWRPITAGDKAGAAVLTAFVILALMAVIMWILLDETSPTSGPQQVAALGAAVATGAFLRKSWHDHGGSDGSLAKGKDVDRASSEASLDGGGGLAGGRTIDANKKFSIIESHYDMDYYPPRRPPMAQAHPGPLIPPFRQHRPTLSEPPIPSPTVEAREYRMSHPGGRRRSTLVKYAPHTSLSGTRTPLE